jgi:outer membrane scaffolding protein for murein synthesis (MipA/OmpV family)
MKGRLPICVPLLMGLSTAGADPKTEMAPLAKPLWEVGLFNFVSSIPDYRGADESTIYAFPLPYLVYRGKHLRATREGVRGIFYQNRYVETSISASGNPPVNRDNKARAGMPDLDALGELGPSVKWFFLGRDPVNKLYLQVSARAAASVRLDQGPRMTYRGIAGGLDAVYYNQSRLQDLGIRYRFTAGLAFGDAGYHRYFYEVAPAYATPERPTYSAEAGYGGFSLSASMQYEITRTVAVGLYTRWDNVDGAVFADSPLVKQNNNYVIGAALILKPWRSATLVQSEELD